MEQFSKIEPIEYEPMDCIEEEEKNTDILNCIFIALGIFRGIANPTENRNKLRRKSPKFLDIFTNYRLLSSYGLGHRAEKRRSV